MMRAALLSLMLWAALALASTAAADTYTLSPCGLTNPTEEREWKLIGNGNWNRSGDCDDAVWLGPVEASVGGYPRRMELELGAVDVGAVTFTLSGGAGSAGGVTQGVAVCGSASWPSNCGKAKTLSAPSSAGVPMEIGAADIPAGADRLVIFAACLKVSCPIADPLKVSQVQVTADDPTAPEVTTDLPMNWVSYVPDIYVAASDAESSLEKLEIYANSVKVWSQEFCELADAWTCPTSTTQTQSLDGLVSGGTTSVRVAATNTGGETANALDTLKYDHSAPGAPSAIHYGENDRGWVIGDHILLRWTNTTESTENSFQSGVVKAEVDLDPSFGEIDPAPFEVNGENVHEAEITVGGSGTRSGQVRVIDRAGNPGDWAPFTIHNDSEDVPAPSSLVVPKINKAAETTGVTFKWSALEPPSELCGFRAALDYSTDTDLGPADPDRPVTVTANEWKISPETVRSLSDGLAQLHLKSVACSDEVSAQYDAPVIVDRTPPTIAVEGIPASGWVSEDGGVKLTPVDSGVGGPPTLKYKVNGGTEHSLTAAGGAVDLSVGDNTIAARATDGAGNTSDRTVSVSLDPAAPSAAMIAPSPSDPTLLQADLTDENSGVVEGELQIVGSDGVVRVVGSTFLAGSGDRGPVRIAGRIPDDGSLPDGPYRVQAFVKDASGRASTTTVFADGRAATVQLPLRSKLKVTAGVAPAKGGAALAKRVFAFGADARLIGSVKNPDGTPVAGVQLKLGGITDDGAARYLGVVTTDARGAYSKKLGADVSRNLTVRFSGDSTRAPASATARQIFRAGVTLSAKRVAGGVELRGRVKALSASIPDDGVPVTLELCPGGHCTAFGAKVDSDSDGGFGLRWPTRKLGARSTLRIRARVRVVGWPFAEGFSKVVKVRIK